ncbi:MAG: tetratricopeptide repeat protein [Anaerolineaceae bacterium]|nr:tetratricopeptide repeat protein [Anaerolineaceae bacterium]
MRKWVLLIGLVVLVMGGFFIVQTRQFHDSEIAALISQSQEHALAARYDDAVADLTAAIEIEPENPELYVLRGQMYLYLYEWDEVLADYNAAIELDPDYPDAYFYRGILYYSILQTGQELRPEAWADFQHYLELAPAGTHADEAARYAATVQAELAALNDD